MADLKEISLEVIKHSDIVKIVQSYLPLVKSGRNFKCVCPFHDDTNPSLTVSPEKQWFKCFVCNTSGNAISFVQKYEKISYFEAVKKVADLSGYTHPDLVKNAPKRNVDPRKEEIIKCLFDLNLYYQFSLKTPDGKAGLDYLNSRNLDESLQSKYKLGYAPKDGKATVNFLLKKGYSIKTIEDTGVAKMLSPGNYADMNEGRVTFPICDEFGNVVGFSARRIWQGDEAKYMNSPETYVFTKKNILYNYHIAKEAARLKGYVYVCEGFMDVFALAKIGIDAAVAIMGTSLTVEHIGLLRKLNVEIRLCLDGDLPGQNAMMKIVNMLTRAGLPFRVVDNQGSTKDPDEILNQDGKEALEAYLNNLVSRMDFALNYYVRSNPLKTIEDKKKIIKEFVPILAKINSQIELDTYLRKLEKATGFDIESIRGLINRYKTNGVENVENVKHIMHDYHPERKALLRLATAERELLYQMLNDKDAVAFYEEKVGAFYDDIYRAIANFVIAYKEEYGGVDLNGLITSVETSNVENKDSIISDMVDISEEDFHPDVCDETLLSNLFETINSEKARINEQDALQDSLRGKDELEQARIIADYNRRKSEKSKKDKDK